MMDPKVAAVTSLASEGSQTHDAQFPRSSQSISGERLVTSALVPANVAMETALIDDPERIRRALRALVAERSRGVILPAMRDPKRARCNVIAVQFEAERPLAVTFQFDGQCPVAPFVVELEGQFAVFRFEVAEAVEVAVDEIAVALPRWMQYIRHRRHRRVAPPAGVTVTLRCRTAGGASLRRTVHNVSWDGLAFETNAERDGIAAGDVYEAEIAWLDEVRIFARLTIVHVNASGRGATDIANARIEPSESEDNAHWSQRVQRLMHPRTRSDGTWSRDLWEMYERSGYFSLSSKSVTDFAPYRSAFTEVGKRLARAPEIGIQVVRPSSRGVEAGVSMLRIYDHSTFLYQLARQNGRVPPGSSGRQILREIYQHALEVTLLDPTLRWLVVWVQESARFSRLAHHDLPARYVPTDRASIRRVRVIEVPCEVPCEVQDVAPATLVPATAVETTRLLELLGATASRTDLEAHDLLADRFDLPACTSAWKRAGLQRERAVLVSRRDGRTVAAAIAESANDGVHLFGLLDNVRMFALEVGGDAAFPELLAQCRQWFAMRGKRKFIHLAEGAQIDAPIPSDAGDLGVAYVTVMQTDLIPELLTHIHEATVPFETTAFAPSSGDR